MIKTNYSSLNPVVMQALNNLQYRYSDKISEMKCSHICYPFKKLLEYNSKYFSKNGFIQMTKRIFNDREFKAERHSFYIYCTIYDSLVFIYENTIECANIHLNKCIAKTVKMYIAYSNLIQKNAKKEERVLTLNSNEVNEIFDKYFKYLQNSSYSGNILIKFKKKIMYSIFNSIKVI